MEFPDLSQSVVHMLFEQVEQHMVTKDVARGNLRKMEQATEMESFRGDDKQMLRYSPASQCYVNIAVEKFEDVVVWVRPSSVPVITAALMPVTHVSTGAFFCPALWVHAPT